MDRPGLHRAGPTVDRARRDDGEHGAALGAGDPGRPGRLPAFAGPPALSLLGVPFPQPRERARAFAVYGAIAGSGAALGLLLGGVLTQYLGWRWCLYVNVPIAVAAALGGWRGLGDTRGGHPQRLDVLGILFATGALVALVYGVTDAVSPA